MFKLFHLRHSPAELQVNLEIPERDNRDREQVRHIAVGDQEIENQVQYQHIQNQPREANNVEFQEPLQLLMPFPLLTAISAKVQMSFHKKLFVIATSAAMILLRVRGKPSVLASLSKYSSAISQVLFAFFCYSNSSTIALRFQWKQWQLRKEPWVVLERIVESATGQ